jgi:hypothetical protein
MFVIIMDHEIHGYLKYNIFAIPKQLTSTASVIKEISGKTPKLAVEPNTQQKKNKKKNTKTNKSLKKS